MDAIYEIAESIAASKYESLRQDTVEAAKKLVLDSIAVALAGSKRRGSKELLEVLRTLGGSTQSTVWVFGDRLPCVHAGQVNATMIHSPDYDDTHDPSPVHTGTIAVPAALAMAEMIGKVDGRQLLTSVALAADLHIRLCMACSVSLFESGWHFTPLHGVFSAVAAAGRLLGLNLDMMVNAFGLAYHQAAGNLQCIHDGALAKRMGPGFAVRDGMMSVLLSRNGITGAKEVLEGRHGFFRVYHGGHYKREVLLEDLGSGKWLQELGFKAYSACRRTHTSIDATLGIVRRHQIKAEEVDAIVVTMDSTHSRMFCEPAEVKRNPRNEVDAQFSIPYTVGAAIVRGKVGLDAFTDKALRDPAILALSNRVEVRIDDSLKRKSHSPGVVEIRTRDGRVYSHRAEAPTGSPENPMDMVSIAEKFRTCAENAAKPLNSENVERLLELCNRLETVADIREIVRLIG